MHKSLLAGLLTLVFCNTAFADTFKTEEELSPFTDSVMRKVGQGDTTAAFELMKPFLIIPEAEIQTMIPSTKAQREQFGPRYGKTVGYECIGQKKLGQSLIRITCIEKTEKHALPWVFYYYKTMNGWVLNSFTWHDRIQAIFPE